jgi:5'(3')-deoxyribonucleotidase
MGKFKIKRKNNMSEIEQILKEKHNIDISVGLTEINDEMSKIFEMYNCNTCKQIESSCKNKTDGKIGTGYFLCLEYKSKN